METLRRAGYVFPSLHVRKGGRAGFAERKRENAPTAGIDIASVAREPGRTAWTGTGFSFGRWPRGRTGQPGSHAGAAADSPLAGAGGVVPAGVVAHVYWPGSLLCALVQNVLGPEPHLSAISHPLNLCRQWRSARAGFRIRPVESVDCIP